MSKSGVEKKTNKAVITCKVRHKSKCANCASQATPKLLVYHMESKGFTVEPALVKITDEGVAYVHVSNQTQSSMKLKKGDRISTAEAEVKITDNNRNSRKVIK